VSTNPTVTVIVAVGEGVQVTLARIVRGEDGRLYIIVDGKAIPVIEKQGEQEVALPEPDYNLFYRWCVSTASEDTCKRYKNKLAELSWPLRLEDLYRLKLSKWGKLAIRAYLNFLEEQGYDLKVLELFRRSKALRVPKSKKDVYIPDIEEVRRALGLLPSRYKLIYIVMLYTGLRLEHVLRLLESWYSLAAHENIDGGCIRIPLPWTIGPKRSFYAYMPLRLKEQLDMQLRSYKIPARESVSRTAKRLGIVRPKYVRKFALHHMARLLGPDIAAHIGGHEEGGELMPMPVAETKIIKERYISVKDLARKLYHIYAEWVYETLIRNSTRGNPRQQPLL